MVGAVVVNVIFTLPFLSGLMVASDDPETGVAGFCPGAALPPGLVQVLLIVVPVQSILTTRSPLPSPVMAALRVSVLPLSVSVGSPPCLNAGFAAAAVDARRSSAATTVPAIPNRRIVFSYFVRGEQPDSRPGQPRKFRCHRAQSPFPGEPVHKWPREVFGPVTLRDRLDPGSGSNSTLPPTAAVDALRLRSSR